jgi:hypothetical protein
MLDLQPLPDHFKAWWRPSIHRTTTWPRSFHPETRPAFFPIAPGCHPVLPAAIRDGGRPFPGRRRSTGVLLPAARPASFFRRRAAERSRAAATTAALRLSLCVALLRCCARQSYIGHKFMSGGMTGDE